MTLLLVSDGGLERSACLLMAEALEQQGERCITAGPTLQGHEPLPTAAPQLNIEVQQLAAHPLLDQVSAIGLFLQDPKQVQRFIQTYQGPCSSRNRPAATVFSGPLVPLVGDALIRDLSLRMGCDLLLVSGEHQRRQLQSLTFNWPASLRVPTVISTGFWFPQAAPCAPAPKPLLLALIQERIPTHIGARDQLLRQLNTWAQQRPHWTVMLQRDHSWTSTRDADAQRRTPRRQPGGSSPRTTAAAAGILHRLSDGELTLEPGRHGLGPDSDRCGRLRHPR